MDIRSIANASTQSVNPNVPVAVRKSTGFGQGAGARQVPTYATDVTGFAQIQAMNNEDLKHLEGLNIQGSPLGIYIKGDLQQVTRPLQEGGDLVIWEGRIYLIVKVLEDWPLWSKSAMVLQGNGGVT